MEQKRIDIKATPYNNGDIHIDVSQVDVDGTTDILMQDILKTREKLTHDALVQLGWTPPASESPIVADVRMLVDAIIGKGFSSEKQRKTMTVYGWANKDGWIREALEGMKLHKLLALYTEGALNG